MTAKKVGRSSPCAVADLREPCQPLLAALEAGCADCWSRLESDVRVIGREKSSASV